MQAKIENPLKSLKTALNKIVLVKLKNGEEYVGRLEQSDGTMNLVLKDCTEYREGTSDPVAKYGRVLIRGSNILFISIDYESIMGKEK
ncbi:U6 snRNA-associated Sm-like protein LSm6 [Sulfolobus acidocaldarius]|uniref:Sm-like protein n=4 Tax=Sulfolobus acidocaldarius TaxID=2285 RepID=Q4JAL0_SULAC|nr:U6 snRNA-associated Sm-like protein LSm6 [Sulfolobus acidocaldarius]5MKL_A1 Chain A1, Sm ribonucleo [Sulfolobus acidocaldarius]5MKL_A2 Chain A2, Sm ribonucleo [Sulfolobus acidocaldarius]5MKL_A3 Chain A3, Sm ribonucleo [Sulfolobus acidocaldarius]5MKL_A4 Chain A4, Sm ribonucleo [Sulfolobus acidocaldarius]5MKL_B1 Chain B1, Sm ribonucleo [Sulfolobus acidocaldarius]5MKL_B2 Chain B2, Sm ribonucleo [Sulfolobus acidocaldarius]5MKL_B3 Chain B3, Sm ribonucleo [Sulfolobus acidocaldarius]5MKL_B4 Cha